jgi:hypothetical protein
MLLLLVVALALSVKLLLQLASTIPAVHKLAFGFRPIVIAYLHLILLLIITVFLLTYLYSKGYIKSSRGVGWILGLFAAGVIVNELVLAAQGILAIQYQVLPYVKEALLGISIWIWISSCLLLLHQWKAYRN